MFPALIFPDPGLRLREGGSSTEVWDAFRKKWVVLTPEEWVRQHLLHWLVNDRGYSPALIAVEREIRFNGLRKRFDAVVFDSSGAPSILCECKAPQVAITAETLAQAGRYNGVIRANAILLTNGLTVHTIDLAS